MVQPFGSTPTYATTAKASTAFHNAGPYAPTDQGCVSLSAGSSSFTLGNAARNLNRLLESHGGLRPPTTKESHASNTPPNPTTGTTGLTATPKPSKKTPNPPQPPPAQHPLVPIFYSPLPTPPSSLGDAKWSLLRQQRHHPMTPSVLQGNDVALNLSGLLRQSVFHASLWRPSRRGLSRTPRGPSCRNFWAQKPPEIVVQGSCGSEGNNTAIHAATCRPARKRQHRNKPP